MIIRNFLDTFGNELRHFLATGQESHGGAGRVLVHT